MTPEERIDAHEQWLIDHDRAHQQHAEDLAEIRAILLEVGQALTRIVEHLKEAGIDHQNS